MHFADSNYSDWLQWFTGDYSEYGKMPFRLPNGMRAASTGYVSASTWDDGPVGPGPGTGPKLLPELNVKEADFSVVISKDDAAKLFGPCEHRLKVKCANCNGVLRQPHHCDCPLCETAEEACEACGETGFEEIEPGHRTANVSGIRFNANLIAYALEHSPPSKGCRFDFVRASERPDANLIIRIVMDRSVLLVASSRLDGRWTADAGTEDVFANLERVAK